MRLDPVDCTTKRLGSRFNGRKIERCPRCGRKGAASHYRDGASAYGHKGHVCAIGVSWEEHCYIAAPKPQEVAV